MTIAIEKLQEKTNTTRTNWPRRVRDLILYSDSRSKGVRDRPLGSQGVEGKAFRVPGGQGVGQQGPRRSRGRLTGS